MSSVDHYRQQAPETGFVVVVSAMSGETDRLLGLAKGIGERPSPRELDVLLSTGEQVTIALLCMALEKRGLAARSYTGYQIPITTDAAHAKARIQSIDSERIMADLSAGRTVVVAGFQGVSPRGDITTLGRGGSDTTAVAMAVALRANECQARRMARITFEEMLEMASLGSKVLQIRAVEFAGKYNVPLRVLSSFSEGDGTLISYEESEMEQPLVSGIAFNRDEAQLTVLGVEDRPGIASAILGPIADANIEVDMILQNTGRDGMTDFTFTVNRNDFDSALSVLRSRTADLGAREISGDDKIVKVSLVGVGMRSHAGIASKMFEALAAEGINIRMISTSEIKISVVVDEKYLELGVRALHEAFGLERAA